MTIHPHGRDTDKSITSNPARSPSPEWHIETLSDFLDVETRLDQLERQRGNSLPELLVRGNADFVIRWATESTNR